MKEFANLLQSARYTVIYSGAGMSTESGLPDFRSKSTGLWEQFDPAKLASIDALHNHPKEFTTFYQTRIADMMNHQPNKGHYILTKWEKSGLIKSIITQNVDGFHHKAGSKNVMELHGTLRSLYCHECQRTTEAKAYLSESNQCGDCGGMIRPGVVLFGESLPGETFKKAENESRCADLFIVLGSSLTVSPANLFPLLAVENGAKLVIINYDSTPYDAYADLVIQDHSIQEVLIGVDKIMSENFNV